MTSTAGSSRFSAMAQPRSARLMKEAPNTWTTRRSGKPRTVGATEESVRHGDIEVWEIYNITGDVHPMHFHLVNVQLINRQLFDESAFPTFVPAGPVLPPEPNELGWKETVPMYPGTVTRVIMRFDLPQIVDSQGNPIATPASPRTGGQRVRLALPHPGARGARHDACAGRQLGDQLARRRPSGAYRLTSPGARAPGLFFRGRAPLLSRLSHLAHGIPPDFPDSSRSPL